MLDYHCWERVTGTDWVVTREKMKIDQFFLSPRCVRVRIAKPISYLNLVRARPQALIRPVDRRPPAICSLTEFLLT